ncbi:MAG TPA: phosphatidylserine/phosphatidylglycerophosphate/cardiolipin synthase family protein [Deltaproteobacteria bacterium]|nr:phosphatidylserine/phosphatidylglycerophosphate/cardiolipin synthase family protein [Deltaproteobacteria bacterium]
MPRTKTLISLAILLILLACEFPRRAFAQPGAPDPAMDADILAPSRQGLLEELSSSRTLAGNHITILDHGPSAFQTWRSILSSARTSIYLQTYFLEDEGMCSNLIDILKEKAAQGVKVAVIITRYSQLGKAPLTYLELKKAGIDVIMIGNIGFPKEIQKEHNSWVDRVREDARIFRSLPREAPFRQWFEDEKDGELMVDYALHEKMVIVDGTVAIIGGRNVSDSYFFWWRDIDVALEGPIVGDVIQAFERNWHDFGGDPLPRPAFETKKPLADGVGARLTQSRPWLGQYHNLDAVCGAIDMAAERVYISSQYLALPPRLTQSLADAARRGVDVRILTNSLETGREVNFALCHFISLNYYGDLMRSGVSIYEYQSPPGIKLRPYYHAKQFIIDGKYLLIGSFNLSIRSSYLESELMLAVTEPSLAATQEKKFLEDLEYRAQLVGRDELEQKQKENELLMGIAKRLEILY